MPAVELFQCVAQTQSNFAFQSVRIQQEAPTQSWLPTFGNVGNGNKQEKVEKNGFLENILNSLKPKKNQDEDTLFFKPDYRLTCRKYQK